MELNKLSTLEDLLTLAAKSGIKTGDNPVSMEIEIGKAKFKIEIKITPVEMDGEAVQDAGIKVLH